MPPPLSELYPLVMVRPEMVTTVFEPVRKTRLVAFPSTARFAGPGPRMVTLLVTSNSPVVRRMEPEVPVASMVSPLAALARTVRSVPGPLSAVLVTVIVAARLVHGPRAAAVAQSNNSRAPTTATGVNPVFMGRFLSFVFIVWVSLAFISARGGANEQFLNSSFYDEGAWFSSPLARGKRMIRLRGVGVSVWSVITS